MSDRWTLTRYGRKYPGLISKLSHGKRIGHNSKYGKVSMLLYNRKPDARFVLKTMAFTSHRKRKIFDTEIRVGSKPFIQRVGPRVLAWKYVEGGGMYIMDDVRMGVPGARMKSLGEMIQYGQLTNRLWKKVLDKVEEFHRITGGQHGDLHDHNIMVVKTNGKTSIKIIDYGAFRSYRELRNIGRHVSYHRGMKVYNLGNGQNFIKNKNWLKHVLNGSSQTPQSEYLL